MPDRSREARNPVCSGAGTASGSAARARRQDVTAGCTAALVAVTSGLLGGSGRGRATARARRQETAPAAVLPVLPDDEQQGRVEDRGVRPGDDPEEQRQHELLGRAAAEQQERR